MKNKLKIDEIESVFEEALKLRDSGEHDEAIIKLNQILDFNRKSNTAVLGILGNVYWDINDWEKALVCYNQAVVLSPKSSTASLGLFHTLANMDRIDEGLAELKRFLSISKSEEHFRLIEEMRDALLDDEAESV